MISEEKKQKILEIYHQGASITEISKKLNIDRHTGGAIVTEMNLAPATEAGFAEFDAFNRERETIVNSMPSIAKSAKNDPVISEAMEQQNIYVLSKEEVRVIKELRSISDEENMKRGDVAILFSRIVHDMREKYGETDGTLQSSFVYRSFSGYLELMDLFGKKRYKRDEVVKILNFYGVLQDTELDLSDVITVNSFLKLCHKKRFDIMRFIRKYKAEEVLDMFQNHPYLVAQHKKLTRTIIRLGIQKNNLKAETGVQGDIVMAKAVLFNP